MSNRSDRYEAGLNILVIFLSILIMFASLEFALTIGLLDPGSQRMKIVCDGPLSENKFHETYGKIKQPNSQYLKHWRGTNKWALHTHNSQGFRDTYDTGSENIVVLGDSYMEGFLADDNATYEHLLDRWSSDTAFHNYGIGGYGTAEELLVYRHAVDYEHEVVIIGYYPNDMKSNVESSARRPVFELVNGSLVQTRQPIDEGTETGLLNNPLVDSTQTFLARNTRTYGYLAPRVISVMQQFNALLQAGDKGNAETITPPAGEELETQRKITNKLIQEIADEAQANDAEVLIVFIPESGDVNPSKPSAYTKEAGTEYWNIQRKMLRSIAENRSNVSYLDLKDPLQEAPDGVNVYGRINRHLTERGYRIAAIETYGWLADHGYVDPPPAVEFRKKYDYNGSSCPS